MTDDLLLPRRWLRCSWVERFCTAQDCNGSKVLNTAAVDEPDLFLWIRNVHYPQLIAKQYRNALRDICKDERPGYKQSMLANELRKLLKEHIKKLGKKRWAAQTCALDQPVRKHFLARLSPSTSATTNVATRDPESADLFGGANSYNVATSSPHSQSTISIAIRTQTYMEENVNNVDSHTDQIFSTNERGGSQHPICMGARSHADMSGNLDSDVPELSRNDQISRTDAHTCKIGTLDPLDSQPLPKRIVLESSIPVEQRFSSHLDLQLKASDDSFSSKGCSGSLGMVDSESVPKRIPVERNSEINNPSYLDFELDASEDYMLMAEPEFNLMRFDAEISDDDDDDDMRVPPPDPSIDERENYEQVIPPLQNEEFVKEFDDLTSKLQDFGLMSKLQYYNLEQHYTSCFSNPDQVCFVIYYTNRHWTGKPESYVNKKSVEVLGVDMSKKRHLLNQFSTVRRLKELMAVAQPGEMVSVPEIWVNCVNAYGIVIKVLCDAWAPAIKLNGDEGLFLFALRNSNVLLRQPGPFSC